MKAGFVNFVIVLLFSFSMMTTLPIDKEVQKVFEEFDDLTQQDKLLKMLKDLDNKKKLDVNAVHDSKTLLGKALKLGYTQIVVYLIKKGANVNLKSGSNTPLEIALEELYLDAVKELIKAGAVIGDSIFSIDFKSASQYSSLKKAIIEFLFPYLDSQQKDELKWRAQNHKHEAIVKLIDQLIEKEKVVMDNLASALTSVA